MLCSCCGAHSLGAACLYCNADLEVDGAHHPRESLNVKVDATFAALAILHGRALLLPRQPSIVVVRNILGHAINLLEADLKRQLTGPE